MAAHMEPHGAPLEPHGAPPTVAPLEPHGAAVEPAATGVGSGPLSLEYSTITHVELSRVLYCTRCLHRGPTVQYRVKPRYNEHLSGAAFSQQVVVIASRSL